MSIGDQAGLSLLAMLLRQRLFDVIREKNAKTYALDVSSAVGRGNGNDFSYTLAVQLRTDPETAVTTRADIGREVEAFAENSMRG